MALEVAIEALHHMHSHFVDTAGPVVATVALEVGIHQAEDPLAAALAAAVEKDIQDSYVAIILTLTSGVKVRIHTGNKRRASASPYGSAADCHNRRAIPLDRAD